MKRIFTFPESIRFFSRRHLSSRQQRGSIMVLTAVSMLALIGMMALAIDLGYLFSAQTQVQNGINAAALAAGAGLRVTIESNNEIDPNAAERLNIAQSLASNYGTLNDPRLFKFTGPPGGKDDAQSIKDNLVVNIDIDSTTRIPNARVRTFVATPTLFAGVFGLSRMKIGAEATASLLPVDGGTGTIASGARGAGCWRPLMLPDTFSNTASDTVTMVGYPGPMSRLPAENGDYYRSRFAARDRDVYPFVDFYTSPAVERVTGLRDTQVLSEIGQSTIMGQPVTFGADYYFIADFASSGLPRDQSLFDLASLGDVTRFGYCGAIRVGDTIKVHFRTDRPKYNQVRIKLDEMLMNFRDAIDLDKESLYHYVASSGYPEPNTHPLIIPVLLYDPLLWKPGGQAQDSITELRVTNFGLFFLKEINALGDLTGYFVREIIAGGTQIEPRNMANDCAGPPNCGFRRGYLPMSVQLIPNKPRG